MVEWIIASMLVWILVFASLEVFYIFFKVYPIPKHSV